jgi:putative transposase
MCHHVMLRGIDGRATFKDDQDRTRFLLLLQEASELCSFRVHAFCLMTNHIHLMIEPKSESLATAVHRFSGRYAQYFNRRHQKRGYVFQGRFRSILVQEGSYIRRLTRYIHLNPVEAKLVTRPEQYRWSSYNAYLERAWYTWLHTDRVLTYFGKTKKEAISEMAVHVEFKLDADMDAEEIRKSFRKGGYGDVEFLERWGLTGEKSVTGCDREEAPCSVDKLAEAVCMKYGTTMNELRSHEKRRSLVQARATLSRAAQRASGLDLGDICRLLGKHQGTVSRLATKGRMDPELDSIAADLVLALSD